MERQLLDLFNVFILFIFVLLLILALIKIGNRYVEYKSNNQIVPLLLKRDFFFLSGLTVPFLGALIFRFTNIDASSQSWYPVWVLGSGIFGILGTLFWVYVEYFKIEK